MSEKNGLIGGRLRMPWTARIAFTAWAAMPIAMTALTVYELTAVASASLFGEQAFWTVVGIGFWAFCTLVVAVGAALLASGRWVGLVVITAWCAVISLLMGPGLQGASSLAFGSQPPEIIHRPGGDIVLDLQPFYLINFIETAVLLFLPAIGVVFGWLPPTLRWAAQRRTAVADRTQTNVRAADPRGGPPSASAGGGSA